MPKFLNRRWERLTAIGIITLGTIVATSEGRRLLENAYVGAPFVMLRNRLRPYLEREDGIRCLSLLRGSGLPFKEIDASRFPPECPIVSPVAIRYPLHENRFVTCRLALAVQTFFEESLQDIALKHLGQRVRKLHDMGVRSCRTMSGHRFLLSEHAYSNAIDIAAFELASGELIEVAKHWHEGAGKEHFLREASLAACGTFQMVITPDGNEEHRDHLHLDLGRSRGCLMDR